MHDTKFHGKKPCHLFLKTAFNRSNLANLICAEGSRRIRLELSSVTQVGVKNRTDVLFFHIKAIKPFLVACLRQLNGK
jgi:hypothetical protein